MNPIIKPSCCNLPPACVVIEVILLAALAGTTWWCWCQQDNGDCSCPKCQPPGRGGCCRKYMRRAS